MRLAIVETEGLRVIDRRRPATAVQWNETSGHRRRSRTCLETFVEHSSSSSGERERENYFDGDVGVESHGVDLSSKLIAFAQGAIDSIIQTFHLILQQLNLREKQKILSTHLTHLGVFVHHTNRQTLPQRMKSEARTAEIYLVRRFRRSSINC